MTTIISITGSSFSGKSTVEGLLCERFREATHIISTTTRDRRVGESHEAYYFVDRDTFCERISNGDFIESSVVAGELYGIEKHAINSALAVSSLIVVVVDPRGASSLQSYCEHEDIRLVRINIKRRFVDCMSGLLSRITSDTISPLDGYKRILRFVFIEYWWRFLSCDISINNSSSINLLVDHVDSTVDSLKKDPPFVEINCEK